MDNHKQTRMGIVTNIINNNEVYILHILEMADLVADKKVGMHDQTEYPPIFWMNPAIFLLNYGLSHIFTLIFHKILFGHHAFGRLLHTARILFQ